MKPFRLAILGLVSAVAALGIACGNGALNLSGITQLKTPLATPMPTEAVFTSFALPSTNTYFGGITNGQDGNLWLTECDADKIARITLSGAITEFPIPTASACPQMIVNGSDGALWFDEINGKQIGRIATDGTITEFPLPPALSALISATTTPDGIAAGPDGNIWFTIDGNPGWCGGSPAIIGVMSTSGNVLATYTTPTPSSGATLIIPGPDGNMWFDEGNSNAIARITMSGTVTEFPIPTSATPICPYGGTVGGMTVGTDGNIWFTERFNSIVARITTSGEITEYGPYNTAPYRFQRIASDHSGNLWFAERPTDPALAGEIGEMTTAGDLVAEYIWTSGAPRALTVGVDNNVWYADEVNDVVGRLQSVQRSSKSLGRR